MQVEEEVHRPYSRAEHFWSTANALYRHLALQILATCLLQCPERPPPSLYADLATTGPGTKGLLSCFATLNH